MLIFGGMAAVGFTYLFGLESTWAHRLMVETLAATIGLLFRRGPHRHGAFELILERFETSKLSNTPWRPLRRLLAGLHGEATL